MSLLVKIEGIRSTRNTRNADPFKPRTDESLDPFHPYTACNVSATVAFIHITLPAPSRMGGGTAVCDAHSALSQVLL